MTESRFSKKKPRKPHKYKSRENKVKIKFSKKLKIFQKNSKSKTFGASSPDMFVAQSRIAPYILS